MKKLFTAPNGSIALRVWLLAAAAAFQAHPAAADQWRATAGAQSHDRGLQALAFLTNEMWIHAGDSIMWSFPTDERHTVTFLAPGQTRPKFQDGCPGSTPDGSAYTGAACVNSDVLMHGQTYSVTFPQPGNYKLVCLVHLYMTGVVHVLDPAATLPHEQAFYDKEAWAEGFALLVDAVGLANRGTAIAAGIGSTAVTAGIADVVATNGGGVHGSAVMRFLKDWIVVHVGDTVEWTNLSPGANHTVTFGPEPSDPFAPKSANVTADADGALHAFINSPGDAVHSGLLVLSPGERTGAAQPPLGVMRFRVTFMTPGTFTYLCTLHDEQGMLGTVVVRP